MTALRFTDAPAASALPLVRAEWDELAATTGNPLLSTAWLEALGAVRPHTLRCVLGRDEDGTLRAGATVTRRRPTGLSSGSQSLYFDEWGVLGEPDERAQVWRRLAELGRGRLRLAGLRPGDAGHSDAREARAALADAGYVLAETAHPCNPRATLVADWDTYLGGLSRNVRSQYRRRRRQLERHGAVALRVGDPRDVADDLQSFLHMEAAGWKGRAGTAILSSTQSTTLYRGFCLAAARQGWLRLEFLEVAGEPVAANLSCVFGGGTFMFKTTYDERYRDESPGFVLQGEAIRAAIEDGVQFYDLMAAPEPYKTQWGGTPVDLVTIDAYRGPAAPVMVAYRRHVRPVLARARRAARERLAR